MSSTIAVAISGGIDSLVSAALLIDEGHSVFGLHFTTGYEPDRHGRNADAQRLDRLKQMTSPLGIAVHQIDLHEVFQTCVIDYFTATYRAGLTPNPCLACNPAVKFGALLDHARRLGADRLATGHYARIGRDDRRRPTLLKGVDTKKDQSYFLARLSIDQLDAACFPLGDITKQQTRRIAADKGLVPVSIDESQDVCFIDSHGYDRFMAAQDGIAPTPGPIEDTSGRVIGTHPGLHRFTIGQRRGINCPAPEPYYVVRIDPTRNCLIVGGRSDLLRQDCRVNRINWMAPTPSEPFRIKARVRYRHQEAPALLTPVDSKSAVVRFDSPQSAITPGQGAVFYDGDRVLGAGWIQ